MSAVDEAAGVGSGKSTQGSGRLHVGDATRALTLPQLPYGDAVHTELASAGLPPDFLESGLRIGSASGEELFLRLVWLPSHPSLSETVQPYGLTLSWSPMTGWSAVVDERAVLLDVDELAAPELLGDAVRHLTAHGLDREWMPPADGRWQYALELDIALSHFDERPVTR